MRTIDIFCTRKDNSCNACPIKAKCDELDEATEFNLWEVYEQGRADAIEELKLEIVSHLNDYALQEAPMLKDDLAKQKPIYDAINNCIEGVIEIAEKLREKSND